MNLFELQTRANLLVDKVNAYEQSLTKENINEDETLAQQKYLDIYSLRPVLKLLFGDNINDKIDRTLNNNLSLPIYASSAPMWNTKFNLLGKDSTFIEPDFEQPVLSSNGTLGGNSFAVACSSYYPESINRDAYNATVISLDMDNSRWQSYNGRSLPQYLIYYNPQPIRLTILQLFCEWPAAPQDFEIQGSNDNSTYTTIKSFTNYIWDGSVHNIEINETNSYKYYRLYVTKSRYGNSNELAMVGFMKLIGKLPGSGQPATWDFSSDKHEFMNSIDILNNHNMIQLDATQKLLTYNNEVYSDEELRTKQGINYLYSSNIQDAVATESQIANMFKWNTTSDLEMKDNTITTYSQVPGIVMYYIGQGGFDYSYSPSISHSDKSTLNSVSFEAPTYNGSLYLPQLKSPPSSANKRYIQSQDIFDSYAAYDDKMKFNLRMFIPGTHYSQGRLESPQQIWIPDIETPEYIQHGTQTYNNSKYNYQSHALYHELVFKGRRSGAKENGFDFIPTLKEVVDNDPQGLATRLALAKNKDYYINRPFFNELSTEYEFDSSKLADKINEIARTKYTSYDLNTTYVTNTDSTAFNNSTGIITGKGTTNPKIESLITCGTDTDSTNPKTKYIELALLLDLDWSSITTSAKYLYSFNGLDVYIYKNSSNIIEIKLGGGNCDHYLGDVTTTILSEPGNCLILRMKNYGTRVGTQSFIYNKNTKSLPTKAFLNSYSTTKAGNQKFVINNIKSGVTLTLAPQGINLNILPDQRMDADIGQIHEYDSANSIDRLVDLVTRTDVDRPMTDSEFYNQYKLDYETYAEVFDLPL